MSTSLSGNSGMRGRTGSSDPFKGTGVRQIQTPNWDQNGMDLYKSLFSHVGPDSYLSKLAGGDQSTFDQIEAPALKQFSQLQGGIASRFSGASGGGRQTSLSGRRSSGFNNEINQHASDFASKLQANRQGLQQSAISSLKEMADMLLSQKPYTNRLMETKPKSNYWGNVVGGALPIAGAAAGGAIGSAVPGIGTLAGAQLGGSIGGAAGRAFL